MPPQTQLLIVDKIKAWAFPSMFVVISFFLVHFFNQQNELILELQKTNMTQIKQAGQNELIIFRLNSIDKEIDKLQK